MSTLDLHPATKVKSTAVEHIEVLGWQVVNSEQEESANPDQTNMLPDPPHVVVQRILHTPESHSFMLPCTHAYAYASDKPAYFETLYDTTVTRCAGRGEPGGE